MTIYAAGWRVAVKDQGVETTSDVLSLQFIGPGGRGDSVSAIFEDVAGTLDLVRETAHQLLGELAYAVGRSLGLPPWAAEVVSRVVVSVSKVVLPFDAQLQIAAVAIRAIGLSLEAEIDAHEGRRPAIGEFEALEQLATALDAAFAPFAEVEIVQEVEVTRIALPLTEQAIEAEVRLIEAAIRIEAEFVAAASEVEAQLIAETAEIAARTIAPEVDEVSQQTVESPEVDSPLVEDIAPRRQPTPTEELIEPRPPHQGMGGISL